MDFLELAAARYSVRKYKPTPIEVEKLARILTAGQLAPTAVNKQPQRLLVINERETLAALKECTPFLFDAPAAILVCYDKDACWVRKFDQKSSGDVDAAIVTTHMMMEATELGIGSVWVGHFDPVIMRQKLAIPAAYEPVALLVLGYPADDAKPSPMHNQSLPDDEIIFYNKF